MEYYCTPIDLRFNMLTTLLPDWLDSWEDYVNGIENSANITGMGYNPAKLRDLGTRHGRLPKHVSHGRDATYEC